MQAPVGAGVSSGPGVGSGVVGLGVVVASSVERKIQESSQTSKCVQTTHEGVSCRQQGKGWHRQQHHQPTSNVSF